MGHRATRGTGARTSDRCAGSSRPAGDCASAGGSGQGSASLTTSSGAGSSGRPPGKRIFRLSISTNGINTIKLMLRSYHCMKIMAII